MKYPPNTEIDLKIKGINIHTFFFKYNSSNPYLFILHGLRADTSRNLSLIKLLQDKYNVISIDLPGFGKSRNSSWKLIQENYIEYCSSLLNEIFEQLEIEETKNLILVGISNGSNIILDYLINNQNMEFKKIVLFAPVYSNKLLSMPIWYKTFVYAFSRYLSKDKFISKTVQAIVSSDKIFNFIAKTIDPKSAKSSGTLQYERNQWRLMTMQHWGKTAYDLLSTDYLNKNIKLKNPSVTLIFPENDQYINVKATVNEFNKMFLNPKIIYFDSQEHVPRGDYMEDEQAGESIKKIIEEI